jgi:hypothetical protein
MKIKAYIFDIDGTIADGRHRQQYVRTKPKNWKAYNAAMHGDSPIQPVIYTLGLIHSTGHAVILSSGRQDKDRGVTEAWMKKHNVPFTELYMRKTNDFRDDTIVKKEMLQEIQQKYDIIAVFDDRVKVINMWREQGLYVFETNRTREDF